MSVSILGLSFGAIVGASYSTFCNLSLFIIIEFLTIIFRRQKARILNRNTPFILRFFRCSFFAHYTPTFDVAVHTVDWSIAWFVCGGWSYRRHLQTRRERRSYGHIHFSNVILLHCRNRDLMQIFLGHSFGTDFGSPCWR